MTGTTDSPVRAWGLVLAAGRGTRFGGTKLLVPYRGAPLIQAVLRVVHQGVRSGVLEGAVAVVGRESGDLERLIRSNGLDPVANDDPAAGMGRSLRLGLARLAHLSGPRDAAVIFLGDQPRVRPEVLRDLVAAFRRDPGPVYRPVYHDHPEVPGHPVVVPRSYWELADSIEEDAGFGPLLRRQGITVRQLEVPGDNPGVDLPDDLARLENRSR